MNNIKIGEHYVINTWSNLASNENSQILENLEKDIVKSMALPLFLIGGNSVKYDSCFSSKQKGVVDIINVGP